MKNEELNKEIQAAIQKNLPNQIGEALKERLTQADIDAANLKIANESLKTNVITIADLEEKMDKAGNLKAKEATLNQIE